MARDLPASSQTPPNGADMIRPALACCLVLLAGPALAQAGAPLKTAVDGTFAPHAMPKMSGGVEGFNVDLAEEIGKRMKRPITVDAAQYSVLIPAMQAGTYDFLAAPTTVTRERADGMLFSEGYLNTDFQFLVAKDAPDVTRLEDFKGKTIAVNKGSAYDSWARGLEGKIGWTVESYGTQPDAVQAVLSGRAFATVAGNTVIAWAAKNNGRVKLSFLYSTGLVWAIPFRKDSGALRKEVENAVECMKTDGTMARLHERWFGIPPAPGSAAVTVFPGYGVPDMPGYESDDHKPSCS